MNRRAMMVSTTVGVLLGTLMTVASETGTRSTSGIPADATYTGAASCKKCHFRLHQGQEHVRHVDAFELLSADDLDQVDEHGRACISCHVTGWDQPGGFTSPAASPHLLGVQCEACHGPGSAHIELGKRMLKQRRKEFEPGEDPLIDLQTTACSGCHTPHLAHPTVEGMVEHDEH